MKQIRIPHQRSSYCMCKDNSFPILYFLPIISHWRNINKRGLKGTIYLAMDWMQGGTV